jgi:hypothetical protein
MRFGLHRFGLHSGALPHIFSPLPRVRLAPSNGGGASVIGLLYTDAFGRFYTTLASEFGTKTFDGNLMRGVRLSDLPYADRMLAVNEQQ